MLRPLQSLLVAVDADHSLLISGSGEVIEPDNGVLAVGSGGPMAAAAARALVENTKMNTDEIVKKSLEIAADICVYTNHHIQTECLPSGN
jgi:ATP-dependent HslUV protease subunit HslV